MYNHVLIATDGSAPAERAVADGVMLAKAIGARVTVLTVTEMWAATEMAEAYRRGAQHPTEDYEHDEAAQADKILKRAAHIAKAAGSECETIHLKDTAPAEGIVKTAETRNCDMIVMGSYGRRGLDKLIMGSQVDKVRALTTKTLLIHR